MNCARLIGVRVAMAMVAVSMMMTLASAQEQPRARQQPSAAEPGRGQRAGGGARIPAVRSPEVRDDRRVTFRILAPKAENVRLSSSDIPGDARQRALTKDENGVWELTLGPIDPGTYRYVFDVDGVSVIDPRSGAVSESNGNAWSVAHVPGSDFMDTLEVPHGSVARVHYHSTALGRARRMHVYTPPGYESGQEKYPVLYLLHGASDSDDSWTSVGRANFILDNLIAVGKVKPMIVVMPAGHTGPFSFTAPPPSSDGRPNLGANAFEEDFVKDIRPYVEKHYRVLGDRSNRAIAGLSMGGAQTLNIALPHLKDFGYVGVFSSGMLFRNLADWEKENQDILGDAGAKEGLRLLWFATGSQDFLMPQTRQTVEFLKRHGFNPVFKESSGGHTWINWRNYLNEFAPQLFGAAGEGKETPAATRQDNAVAGKWQAQFDTQIGVQKYAFEFKVDDGKLIGTAVAQIGDAPQRGPVQIGDGKIAGDRISFSESFTFNDMDLKITYTGKIAGDEIRLTRQVGDFVTEELVAKRVKGEASSSAMDAVDSGRQGAAAGRAPSGFDAYRDGIERGRIETVEYDSKTVGIKRKMVIYTPPGYSKGTQYPVLYLLHGTIGDTEAEWSKNNAHVILDNLIADKGAVPMVVVMPYGRAIAEPAPARFFGGNSFEAYGNFENDLLKDVIPFVESHYSVKADREHRALAGLSMGGGQSLNFGLKHLDTFAWVGGFSSAPNTKPARELIVDPAEATKKLRLLWVSCGDTDRLMNISRDFHDALDEMKVPHVWHIDSGGHTWPVWKNDLYLLSQRLFKNTAAE